MVHREPDIVWARRAGSPWLKLAGSLETRAYKYLFVQHRVWLRKNIDIWSKKRGGGEGGVLVLIGRKEKKKNV